MLYAYSRGLLWVQGPFRSGKDFCSETNLELKLCADDDALVVHFKPAYLPTAEKVWSAVVSLIQEKSGSSVPKDPGEVVISTSFIDHVFRPLIPDSPLLRWSHEGESSWKRTIGVVGLAVEAPFRLIVVLTGHLLLSAYSNLLPVSQETANHVAYLQFRLNINSYSPTQEIAQRIDQLF